MMPSDHVMDTIYAVSIVDDLYNIFDDKLPLIQLEFDNISKQSRFNLVNALTAANGESHVFDEYQWDLKPVGNAVRFQHLNSSKITDMWSKPIHNPLPILSQSKTAQNGLEMLTMVNESERVSLNDNINWSSWENADQLVI